MAAITLVKDDVGYPCGGWYRVLRSGLNTRGRTLSSVFRNTFLQRSDQQTIHRLQLRSDEMQLLHELETPGNFIDTMYFC